ncbi:hypothetical protein [Mycobacterium sp. SM3041]|uniref:hypothetical protein n=1 Tax=Mycobacterium sp. SM3041 TaxID=3114291 RepID=UPI0032047B0E
MRESFDDRLARIGAEVEAGEADQTAPPVRERVSVTRPGHARSKVLQVRLNPEEFEALEALAAARELPVSTIAREQLLRLIEHEKRAPSEREALVEALVFDLVLVADRLKQAVGSPRRADIPPIALPYD